MVKNCIMAPFSLFFGKLRKLKSAQLQNFAQNSATMRNFTPPLDVGEDYKKKIIDYLMKISPYFFWICIFPLNWKFY